MIKVNLLEQARRESTPKAAPSISFEGMGNLPNIVTIALLVLTVGWIGYKYWTLTSTQRQLTADIADAEVQLKQVEEDIRVANELEAKRERVQQQIDLIIQLKERQQVPVRLLDQISRNLPDFLWLTNFNETGGSLTFSGKATTPTAYANFYNNLNASPYFADVGRISYREEPSGGVSFSLAATFNPKGPARAAGPPETAEGGL